MLEFDLIWVCQRKTNCRGEQRSPENSVRPRTAYFIVNTGCPGRKSLRNILQSNDATQHVGNDAPVVSLVMVKISRFAII